ncbi:MFS transporter [Kosmotoga pacifica]|uniref:MFS transporter n=1 Tax=Kosmotoga pacifica TaxID=1330330 RepID=A0A0G2ZAA7_9BACT|nr:MFS transporter [Kosmotoga pacifica]AKI96509.1 MFS transporter [Kosmotoga pacifica]
MNIDKVIEKYVPVRKQSLLLFFTSLEWMIVAAGVMILSLTLPGILSELPGAMQVKGTIASSVFIGMLIGAFSSGLLSDFFGRKWANLSYLILAGFFTYFTGMSKTPETFILFRLFSGIGYGGLLPVVNAYLTEFTAIRIRGRFLTLLESSWAIGSILMGLFTVLSLDTLGWRWSYYGLSLISIPLLIVVLVLPESPKIAYLKKGKKGLEKVLGVNIEEEVEVTKHVKMPIISLFNRDYFSQTIMVWILWFSVSFVYYGLFIWAPKIFSSKGITPQNSLWYTFFMLVMQLPGYLLAAYLIEKIGRKKSTAFFFLGTGFSTLLMAAISTQTALLISSVIISIFCLGAWGMVYAYTPELYPTKMRGLGNGAAGVMARIAGIVAPYYTAFIMDKTNSITMVMIPMAALATVSAILAITLGRETKGLPVE